MTTQEKGDAITSAEPVHDSLGRIVTDFWDPQYPIERKSGLLFTLMEIRVPTLDTIEFLLQAGSEVDPKCLEPKLRATARKILVRRFIEVDASTMGLTEANFGWRKDATIVTAHQKIIGFFAANVRHSAGLPDRQRDALQAYLTRFFGDHEPVVEHNIVAYALILSSHLEKLRYYSVLRAIPYLYHQLQEFIPGFWKPLRWPNWEKLPTSFGYSADRPGHKAFSAADAQKHRDLLKRQRELDKDIVVIMSACDRCLRTQIWDVGKQKKVTEIVQVILYLLASFFTFRAMVLEQTNKR